MLPEALFHVSDSLSHAYIAICANWFHVAHQCHYDSNSTVGSGNETENVSECEIVLSSPVCVYRDSISDICNVVIAKMYTFANSQLCCIQLFCSIVAAYISSRNHGLYPHLIH